MSQSWHIPSIKAYRQPDPDKVLHVVFLQRLPQHTRNDIVKRLATTEGDWAAEFDPAGDMSVPRQLRAIPWIRDSPPSPEATLEILRAQNGTFKSFILVDFNWEASNVIAANWSTVGDDEPKLDAVRVPIGMANALLTLIDNEAVSGFSQVLGEAEYKEKAIDLYTDAPLERQYNTDRPSYELPSFLPSDLKLDRSKLELVSLLELTEDHIEAIRTDILRNAGEIETVPVVVIHNWKGPSPSRSDLRQLYDQMYHNSAVQDRHSLAWFVDSILEDDDHRPRVVAFSIKDQPKLAYLGNQHKVSLFVPEKEGILRLFNECRSCSPDACYEKAEECCDKTMREDVVALRNPIDFGDDKGDPSLCPVFYLSPFNTDEERAIKSALNNEDDDFVNDIGKDFAYYGYLFPPGSGDLTIQDLCELFQKCDPLSPTFDPSYSNMRFKGYVPTFVAVDRRCLDAESPKVVMTQIQYHWFRGADGEDNANYSLGWLHGEVATGMAWSSYVNLWISNMDLEELATDYKMLYLHDLEEHEKENPRDEEEWI